MPDALKHEIYGDPAEVDAFVERGTSGKAALTRWHALLVSAFDSLGLCMFPVNNLGAWGPTHLSRLCSAHLGKEISPRDVMEVGERIQTLMKVYIVREGFTRRDDAWPRRFYDEPIQDGARKGTTLREEVMDRLVSEFYSQMGWDPDSGRPTQETLRRLGLEHLIQDIW